MERLTTNGSSGSGAWTILPQSEISGNVTYGGGLVEVKCIGCDKSISVVPGVIYSCDDCANRQLAVNSRGSGMWPSTFVDLPTPMWQARLIPKELQARESEPRVPDYTKPIKRKIRLED